LALLSVELEMFGQQPSSAISDGAERMKHFSAQAKSVSSELHRLAHALHPAKLDQLGLETALRGFCREFARAHHIAVSFTASDVPRAVSDDVALCIYRIAQEALQNVVKHSGATTAEVSLVPVGQTLVLRIEDDGVGFQPESNLRSGSLGIVGMGERARFVGGRFTIDSLPDGGSRVEVCVPLETESSRIGTGHE
jgi:signal transduction histidine kinase